MQEYKSGDRYIKSGGCPRCGADLEITHGCMEICVNFQHPHIEDDYNRSGLRNCGYVLVAG